MLEYLCVSISKGEGGGGGEVTEEKRALRFGQKCKDESRSRGREKAVFGLEEGEAAYSWLFTRAHTHTHICT